MSEEVKAALAFAAFLVLFVVWNLVRDCLARRANKPAPVVLPRGRGSHFTGPTAQTLFPSSEGHSPMSDLKTSDITCEEWREYEFGLAAERTAYRIQSPATLYHRPGGTTHRVVDAAGIAHCLPAPGQNGCVLRWKSKDPAKPVAL